MKTVEGFRPVALNVGVRDIEEAIEFYEAVFEAKLEVAKADGRPVHARWQFGEGDSLFLLNLRERDADEPHRHHTTAFGFNAKHLEEIHRRAVAAGAQEHFPPTDEEGLPRHSRFQDPSGNRIVLWQA